MTLFKSLLGFCGDAVHPYPEQLACDAANLVLADPGPLRAEAYVQVMKQLTANPRPESADKCWQYLTVLLATRVAASDHTKEDAAFAAADRRAAPAAPPAANAEDANDGSSS